MRVIAVLALCVVLSCSILPKPSSPSARPGRLLGSSHTSFARGEVGIALDLCRQAEREARGFDDRETEIAAILARAGIYRWLASEDSARSAAARAVSKAREADTPCLEVEGLLVAWAIEWGSPEGETYDPAALKQRCSSRLMHTRIRFMQARIALSRGDAASARQHLARPRRIPRAARAEINQEHRFLTAWLRSFQGRREDAVSLAERVLVADRDQGVKPAIVDDLLLLARIHRRGGDEVRAGDCIGRAIDVIESMHPRTLVANRLERARAFLQ